jgi:hypothetical protein
MATKAKVTAAFLELELAAIAFKAAQHRFQNVYDPNAVGMTEWQESIDDTLFEIKEDINAHFGE